MRRKVCVVVLVVAQLAWVKVALADLVSPNYHVGESFIGGGGLNNESSTNYSAGEAIGDVGTGDSSSTTYQSKSGFVTPADPTLTFIVNTSNLNLGTLSTSSTGTGVVSMSVINYTSYGYNLQIVSSPPSTGSYTLAGMTSQAASSQGTEQFGINVVANTSPVSQGANPVGGFGAAAAGYNSTNLYKYVPGDVIASAAKSSGQTNYVVSYIANISNTSGAGVYTGSQTYVVTGTY